jgi:hypothetical protein
MWGRGPAQRKQIFKKSRAIKDDNKNSRVVELVLEWRALLYGESVGLPGELVPHHLQVAVRQRLVPDIRRIS